MKVLLASPYGGIPGGISRWTEHILAYHKTEGNKDCELDLLPMGRTNFVNLNSSLFYRLLFAFRDYRNILKAFNQKLKNNRYDVMHLTTSASISLLKDIYMVRRAHSKGIKTIIHFRFGRIPDLSKNRNWEWKLLCKVLKIVDRAIVIDMKSFRALADCGFKNILLLPNPLAENVIRLVGEKQNSLTRSDNTVLFVGHVIPTKGIFELMEACRDINIKLKYVGHVEEETKNELMNQCHNADNVEICGELPYEAIIEEMLKCGIFVLPTYTEGFPNVILESMACACPIVTTNVGAIPEMLDVENGFNNGICVEPRDIKGLRSAIGMMLNDREYALECGKNAQQRVVEQYSMSIIWKRLVHIWKTI